MKSDKVRPNTFRELIKAVVFREIERFFIHSGGTETFALQKSRVVDLRSAAAFDLFLKPF